VQNRAKADAAVSDGRQDVRLYGAGLEQVGMHPRAGSDKHKVIMLHPIDEQPVALDVAFPETRIIPAQLVVAVFWIERLLFT